MRRRIIKVDGSVVDLPGKQTMDQIRVAIGARAGLDVVRLSHLGYPLQIMLVDDMGHPDGKPNNPGATRLYRLNAKPGTTHWIAGDVAIVLDEDFA